MLSFDQGSEETFDPVRDASGSEEASSLGSDQAATAPSLPGHAPAPLQHQRTHCPGGLKRRDLGIFQQDTGVGWEVEKGGSVLKPSLNRQHITAYQ